MEWIFAGSQSTWRASFTRKLYNIRFFECAKEFLPPWAENLSRKPAAQARLSLLSIRHSVPKQVFFFCATLQNNHQLVYGDLRFCCRRKYKKHFFLLLRNENVGVSADSRIYVPVNYLKFNFKHFKLFFFCLSNSSRLVGLSQICWFCVWAVDGLSGSWMPI